MANENEDSFADDPLEEINLDDDDLDDLLGEGGAENTNDDSSEDDDLLSDDDLLEVDSEDEDSGGEISEEELDSLLADADSPDDDDGDAEPAELSSDELDALLADDEAEDATDVLGEDDQPPELPDVPDSLPEDIGSEIEEELPELEDDAGSSKKKSFTAPKKGKKKSKGFASKEGSAKPKKPVSPASAKAAGGKRLDFICSECYSVLALSATYSEEIVTCPECFHVGKKPDDSFLRTVSTAKAGEGKKALVLTLLSCLMVICFSGIVFLNSAYGDAASMTEANTEAPASTAKTVDDEGAEVDEVEAELFKPAKEDEEFVDLWQLILLCGGSVFLLLLIWQACVYEGNRWEAYF
ncbi:MAG: hypothetical protein VCD16_07225 [Planctomycetota bacterium]